MEEDIYGDLENYNDINALDELRKENQQLKYKVEEYASIIARLQKDLDKVKQEFKTMESNFSSLLKTARAEIERKTQIICNLNIEKDKLVFTTLQNYNRNILNIKKNLLRGRSLSKNKTDSEGSKSSRDFAETKKIEAETGRKDDNRLPSIETVSSVDTEESNEIANIDKSKRAVYRTDESKENVSDFKPKSQSIRNRRKSMPALNKSKFSSDEEDNCNEETNNKEWYLKDDKHRKAVERTYAERSYHKTSETSGIDEKYSSYHESSRDTYYRESFGRMHDRYRNTRDKKEPPQRQKRLLSPERNNKRPPKEYSERSRNSETSRYRRSESPSSQRRGSYYRNRSRERKSNVERERYDRSRSRHDRYRYKQRLYDEDEPLAKKARTNSATRHFEEVHEVRDVVEETNIPKDLVNVNLSCQSPDLANYVFESVPVREIMNSSAIPLEDPRFSSNRYITETQNHKNVLTALSSKNLDLFPIHTTKWNIQQVEMPDALRRLPNDTDRIVQELYGDIDPVCSAPVEHGEIQSHIVDHPEKQDFHHNIPNSGQYNNIETKEKLLEDEPKETNPTKPLEITKKSSQYKIPKIKKSVEHVEIQSHIVDQTEKQDFHHNIKHIEQYNNIETKENPIEDEPKETNSIKPQEITNKSSQYKIPKIKKSVEHGEIQSHIVDQTEKQDFHHNIQNSEQYNNLETKEKALEDEPKETNSTKPQEITKKSSQYKTPKTKKSVEHGEIQSHSVDQTEKQDFHHNIQNSEQYNNIETKEKALEDEPKKTNSTKPQEITKKSSQYKILKTKKSVEDGEIQSHSVDQTEKQDFHHNIQNSEQYNNIETKEKALEDEPKETNSTTPQEITKKSSQYKISKLKKSDKVSEQSIPNPLGKLLCDYNITPLVDSVKNSVKLNVDAFYSPDKEKTEPEIQNHEVLNKVKKSIQELVEGDLELSDETSDNIDIIRKKKSVKLPEKPKPKENAKHNSVSKNKSNEKKNKPITLRIAKDKNTQYRIEQKTEEINQSIPESNKITNESNKNHSEPSKKQKTKKKSHKGKRNSQEAKSPTEVDKEDEKRTSKSKKDPNKPKEIQSKFSDLFGESSSLITPEDLGAVTRNVDGQSSNKYIPIFEDAQDAIDMSLTPVKSDLLSISNLSDVNSKAEISKSQIPNTENQERNKISEPVTQNVDRSNCVTVTEKSSSFVNLNPQSLVPEADVVNTVIISTGVQSQVIIERMNTVPFLDCNTAQLVDNIDKDAVNSVISRSVNTHVAAEELSTRTFEDCNLSHKLENTYKSVEVFKRILAPVALATSTPHKSTFSCTSSDSKVSGNHSVENLCQSNGVDTGDQEDVPEFRIFVKRRRKVLKKAVSK